MGPFSVIDADSGKKIQINRAAKLSTAFTRLDRYLAVRPGCDALVVDDSGRPVPRPHHALPTRIIDGRTPAERRQRSIWLAFRRVA